MSSSRPGAAPAARRSRFGVACLVLLACYTVPLVTFAVLVQRASRVNASGQCTGIGFGCTLTPHDTLVFAGTVVGAPALAIGLLLSGVTAALLARDEERFATDLGLLSGWPAFLGFAALLALAAGSA